MSDPILLPCYFHLSGIKDLQKITFLNILEPGGALEATLPNPTWLLLPMPLFPANTLLSWLLAGTGQKKKVSWSSISILREKRKMWRLGLKSFE